MPSPFPGMDPYLESSWEDVHHSLIGYARDALAPKLPPGLVARKDDRVYVDFGGYPAVIRKPDVRVVDVGTQRWPAAPVSGPAVALVASQPVLLDFANDPITEGFLQIMDARGGKIVTAIEVISPANKLSGAGRRAYLQKREEFLRSNANLVEIDVVRSGDWVTLLSEYLVPKPYQTTYRVSVRRSTPNSKGELYPVRLAERLPVVSVPLRPGDADVLLDLQSLVDQAYLFGGYDNTDYSQPCNPPLTGAEADWADALLRAAGRR